MTYAHEVKNPVSASIFLEKSDAFGKKPDFWRKSDRQKLVKPALHIATAKAIKTVGAKQKARKIFE